MPDATLTRQEYQLFERIERDLDDIATQLERLNDNLEDA